MNQSFPATQQLYTIPDGPAGTRATLKLMSKLVRAYRTDPTILATARDLVMMSPGGDYMGEVAALFYFVRDNIRYMQDPHNVEALHAPDELLQVRAGDCDDKATLLAALLQSIGHPTRFVAVGYEAPGEFQHVFVETKVGNNWIGLETTPIEGESVELGWIPVPPYIDHPVSAYMREWT